MGNLRGLINIQNIDCNGLNLTSGDGAITVNTSTFGNSTSRATCSFATSAGSILFTTNTYRGTVLLQVANNVMNIGSLIRLSNNTWASSSSRCVIAQNNLTSNLLIDNNIDLGIFLITNNVFQSNASVSNSTYTGSTQQLIQSNTLSGPASGILSFGDVCLNLSGSIFPHDVYIANNTGAVYIQPGSTCSTVFNFINNTIDNTYVFPVMSDCNIQYSSFISEDPSNKFINTVNPLQPVNMTVSDSVIDTLTIELCDTLVITKSIVRHFYVNNNPSNFSTLTINSSKVEHTLIDTNPDPITTATINYTELIRGEYTTTYTHDFGTNPLIAGFPIYITDQFWGYVKEKASITPWNGLIESVPGTIFDLGDNFAGVYLSGLVATLGSSSAFTQDTTLYPGGGVMTTGSVLEMRSVGGDITAGSAIIVVSGKYMYPLP